MIKLKLAEMLENKNMTQKELAIKAKARPATISSLCNGTAKTISFKLLDNICTALDCNIEDIVEHNKETNYSFEIPAEEMIQELMKELEDLTMQNYRNRNKKSVTQMKEEIREIIKELDSIQYPELKVLQEKLLDK